MTERLKVHDWKSCGRIKLPRGFESHPLRLWLRVPLQGGFALDGDEALGPYATRLRPAPPLLVPRSGSDPAAESV